MFQKNLQGDNDVQGCKIAGQTGPKLPICCKRDILTEIDLCYFCVSIMLCHVKTYKNILKVEYDI